MDLQDVINQYKTQVAKEEKEDAERKEREFERETLQTFSDFREICLTPDVVEGKIAIFHLDGKAITFARRFNEYTNGYVRLLGPCPKCGKELMTEIIPLSTYRAGQMIVNPEPRYHSCDPQEQEQEQEQTETSKTTIEQLIAALSAYIQEQTNTNY